MWSCFCSPDWKASVIEIKMWAGDWKLQIVTHKLVLLQITDHILKNYVGNSFLIANTFT